MEQLETAVRTLRQLRDTLAAISQYGPQMNPAAISSIAALAVTAADNTLDALGPVS